MKDKSGFRTLARAEKKNIVFDVISKVVCRKLESLEEVKKASVIMLYMALKDEIDLMEFYKSLKSLGKICCFPVVDGDVMYAREAQDDFIPGAFGILEPGGKFILPDSIDLVIVPGVMFDVECNRLGRGKGYYDKFLQDLTAFKIGICPDSLLVDSLPCEEHDLPMDMVITEKRMVFNV